MTRRPRRYRRPATVSIGDVGPSDFRRAAVILGSWAQHGLTDEKLHAALAEIRDADRATQNVVAMLAVISAVWPDILGEEALDNLSNIALHMAVDEAATHAGVKL